MINEDLFSVRFNRKTKRTIKALCRRGEKFVICHGIKDGDCDCGKKSCGSPGKHPNASLMPNGEKDATSDFDELMGMLKKNPNSNLGMCVVRWVVLDIDGRLGYDSLEVLEPLPETATVKTGRGEHRYFVGRLGFKPRKIKGIDIKTITGYVMIPPSVHASGMVYKWKRSIKKAVGIPKSLKQDLREKPKNNPTNLVVMEGGRNNTLTSIGGSLVARGVSETAIEETLHSVNEKCCNPPLRKKEVANIFNSIKKYLIENDYFDDLSNVEATDVTYLFEPYFPRGCITILDGYPKIGKSFFSIWLSYLLTTGRTMGPYKPDGIGRVLMCAMEDDVDKTIKVRLDELGADCDRIRYLTKPFTFTDKGVDVLKRELITHPADLVIFDPIQSYLPSGVNMNSATDMRHCLNPLVELAREFDIAVGVVRHFIKGFSDKAMLKGMGSIDLAAIARSAMVFGKHPDDDELCVVAHAYGNYSKPGQSVVFEIETNKKTDRPRMQYLGTSSLSADEIAMGDRKEPGKREEARELLADKLSHGPVDAQEVKNWAEGMSIAERTLNRAKKDLGVFSSGGRGSTWSLPE